MCITEINALPCVFFFYSGLRTWGVLCIHFCNRKHPAAGSRNGDTLHLHENTVWTFPQCRAEDYPVFFYHSRFWLQLTYKRGFGVVWIDGNFTVEFECDHVVKLNGEKIGSYLTTAPLKTK